MHRRFLGWLVIGLMVAAFTAHAQTPPAPPAVAGQGKFDQNGVILVAQFSGKVEIIVDGVAKQAAVDMPVPPKARVVTAQGARVVLVFSNGASTQLGSDTDLAIEEFLQDPLGAVVKVAEMVDEPVPSRTKLMLNKGELVGNVKKLKYDQGSSFTVQTPVGAAGIRGTTFRIVFRPSGNGQAFFTLTTATGQVEFTQPNQNTGTQTGAGNTQQPTTTTTTETTASGTAAVQVPQGQELVIVDVQVTTNAQGQLVVIATPQTPTAATGAGATNMEAVIKVAQDIAVATQNATFSSPAPSSPGSGGSNPGGTSGSGGDGGGTTGTTTGTASGTTTTTTGTTTSTTTTQTSSISGESFTGSATTKTTTTTTPTTTQATRPSTIPSGP